MMKRAKHNESSKTPPHLPADVHREILLRLPARSLVRLRAVCRSWLAAIDDPSFARVSAAALRLPGFPSPPHLPAANCDGLLLLADKFWSIWNPTTGERLELPRGGYTADVAASGLGLRSNSWRILGSPPPPSSRLEGPGVFLNGALHWISQGPGGIFAFDLLTDSFRQVGEPPAGNHRRGAPAGNWYLDVFGGSLVLSRYNNIDYSFSSQFEVWVMMEYGVSDSWVRLLSAKDRRNFEMRLPPVVYVKDGRKILKLVRGGFCLFDLKSGWSRSVGVGGREIGCEDMSAQVVPGSVFRLHDNCTI
ncbi:F-box and associated interaction domains-containing protein [Striga asiatica]|uniref:F-box and associated interaction domains-containing protein n=1 Tax=Striga asiatica TaxID=4170 RepID=A0A5A7RJC3_STRAF|nr:F-box and associated interaction domains-containing protein [Striga asiatica]